MLRLAQHTLTSLSRKGATVRILLEMPATTRMRPNPLLGPVSRSACKRDNPCVVPSPARLLKQTKQLSKLYHNFLIILPT